MSTGRNLVSEIRSLNKLLNADNNITDRIIFKELKDSARLLIKRETNLRKLWNSPNIFSTIKCLEMTTVPLSECCDYRHPCEVARSKKKIPQISEGIFGLLVQSVFSPGRKKFDYAAIDRFVNIMRLGVGTKKYYWVYDDYLYVSDPDIEFIDIVAYFDDDFNPSEFSTCQVIDESCINPLDKEFPIPSYLEKNLKELVNDTLNKTYFRHRLDTDSNFKDDQASG